MQLGQALELEREIQEITELTYWQVDRSIEMWRALRIEEG